MLLAICSTVLHAFIVICITLQRVIGCVQYLRLVYCHVHYIIHVISYMFTVMRVIGYV